MTVGQAAHHLIVPSIRLFGQEVRSLHDTLVYDTKGREVECASGDLCP